MDDPLLVTKREEAAKAMSLGFSKNPENPVEVITSSIEKKELPIVPVPQINQPKDSIEIAQRRLQAQIAMEGDERRKKREEEARKIREEEEKVRQEKERKKKEEFERQRIERERVEQEVRTKDNREKVSAELKAQVDEVRQGGGGLKTIRTLKLDQDNLIKGQNLSLIGIAIKEEERRKLRQENTDISSGKNMRILSISLLLISISLGIGFYIYNTYYIDVPIGILPGRGVVSQSIIFSDTFKTLDTTDVTLDEILIKIKNEVRNPPDLRLGAIENFSLIKKNTEGIKNPISSEEFFKLIGSTAPDSFLRTLSKEYMFGILSSAENAAFIIIKTESYEKGFAGLLEWESKTLTKDLYQILTSLKPDPSLLTKKFEDLLIRNFDTRILKDKDGNIRLVYGFLDGEKTIIIAGSKQAFTEALNRFNTPKPLSI